MKVEFINEAFSMHSDLLKVFFYHILLSLLTGTSYRCVKKKSIYCNYFKWCCIITNRFKENEMKKIKWFFVLILNPKKHNGIVFNSNNKYFIIALITRQHLTGETWLLQLFEILWCTELYSICHVIGLKTFQFRIIILQRNDLINNFAPTITSCSKKTETKSDDDILLCTKILFWYKVKLCDYIEINIYEMT